jgi:hypothetical protein
MINMLHKQRLLTSPLMDNNVLERRGAAFYTSSDDFFDKQV